MTRKTHRLSLLLGLFWMSIVHAAPIDMAAKAYEGGDYEQALSHLNAVDKANGFTPRAESLRVLSFNALGRTREAYISALRYEQLTKGRNLDGNEAHQAILDLREDLRQQIAEERQRKRDAIQRERAEEAESVLSAVVAKVESQQQVHEKAAHRREHARWIAPIQLINSIIADNSDVYYKTVEDNGACLNWQYKEHYFVYSQEAFKLEKDTMLATFEMTKNEEEKHKGGCEDWRSSWDRDTWKYRKVDFAKLIKAEWKEYRFPPSSWMNTKDLEKREEYRYTEKTEGVGLLELTFSEPFESKLEYKASWGSNSIMNPSSRIVLGIASSRGKIDKLIEAFYELREMARTRDRHR